MWLPESMGKLVTRLTSGRSGSTKRESREPQLVKKATKVSAPKAAAKQPAAASKRPAAAAAAPPAVKKEKAARPSSSKQRVRVWWPPTKNKRRTDYSGMYWPAVVLEEAADGLLVQYDNGDKETVDAENVSPLFPGVDFGKEKTPLQVGEFCEVFNDSPTDPAAWVGRVKKINKKTYTIEYPFHDAPTETIKEHLIRRARIYNDKNKQWSLILPGQEWEDGEVSSPVELELCTEKELHVRLAKMAAGSAATAPPSAGRKAGKAEQGQSKAASSELGPSKGKAVAATAAKKESAATPATKAAAAPIAKPAGQAARAAPAAAKPASSTPAKPAPAAASAKASSRAAAAASASPAAKAALAAAAPAASAKAALPAAKPTSSVQAAAAAPAAAAKTEAKPAASAVSPAAGPASQPAASQSAKPETQATAAPATSTAPVASAPLAALGWSGAQLTQFMQSLPPDQMALLAAFTQGAPSPGGAAADSAKKRKKKDPNAPKKPPTAYLVFTNRHRAEVVAAQPGLSAQDVTKELAKLWNVVSSEERTACEAEAAEEHTKYVAAKEAYDAAKADADAQHGAAGDAGAESEHGSGDEAGTGEESEKKRRKKDKNEPKRARSAYILFSMDHRKQLSPEVAFNEGTKVCAAAWREADAETRAKYDALSKVEKDAYDQEYAAYRRAKAAKAARELALAAVLSNRLPPQAVHVLAAAGGPVAASAALAAPAAAAAAGPALGGEGVAAAPAAPPAAGGEAAVLDELDLKGAQKALARAGFLPDAYYKLVDVWRKGSPLLEDAVRAYRAHVGGRKSKPDWKAFMIGIFGYEACKPLLAPTPPQAPAPAAASSAPGPSK